MGIDRRGVIGLIAGGALGTLVTPMVWKSTDDISIWSQNWPWIPRVPRGVMAKQAAVSKLCPSGTSIKVLTVNGNPVTAAGNPDNPLSQGGVSPLGLAECYMMYSPSRIKQPMKKEGSSFKPISWKDAEALLVEKLKNAGKKIAFVSGDENGTVNEVFSAFTKKLGSENFFIMPCEAHAALTGWSLMGGQGQPGFDLENADTVVLLGANAFETWGPSVRNRRAFSKSRPAGQDPASTYVYVGPMSGHTASVCDKRVAAKPGTEGIIALGIAWHLIQAGAKGSYNGFGEFKALVQNSFTPEKVSAATGVSPETLKELADILSKGKKPLVVVGSSFGQGLGAGAFIAGMCLNMLLNNIGRNGGVIAVPELNAVIADAMTRTDILKNDFVSYLGGETPDVLMLYNANPVYGLPQASAMEQLIDKVPFKVSFNSFMDETTAMADLVMPSSMTLERCDDVVSPYGVSYFVYNCAEPALSPVFDTKPTADVVLSTASALGINLGFSSFKDVIAAKIESVCKHGCFIAKDFMPWDADVAKAKTAQADAATAALAEGYALCVAGSVMQSGLNFGVDVLAKTIDSKPATADLVVAPVANQRIGTPVTGIPCQDLTTIPDNQLLGEMYFVDLNQATAGKLGLRQGDAVKLSGTSGDIVARVNIFEGIMDDVVGAPIGFGHSAFDEFSQKKGDNTFKILTASKEPGTGLSVWAGSAVKIAKI
ncbi:menaquinone reductase molybdopterin-binding-like subunit QrcB [Desulfovibrio inopinatus]|uniref:menaquinone reductase molybdopterin-binding-like subunit QrcB n=1 Tax=Desulfovibrio inopinatus TaxID=102109 RepID=UPI00040D72F2|nr:menaquinone reductase molybdopterin-binding-like subunit QrcB [Desulfovibrio inopinatus]